MKYINRYIIYIIGIILIASASNIQWGGNRWIGIIESDGKGYYSYLPAIFIYHDLQFSYFDSIETKYYENLKQDFRNSYKGKIIDKYYIGSAVAMTPFFLVGHGISLLTKNSPDGYSKYYNILINIAGIFYLLASLYYIRNLLRLYEIKENTISFILVAITFGTNLYYYSVLEPSMSHIYSLAFISAFIYYCKIWFLQKNNRYLIALGALLGIILLIRPVNIILIFAIPFIAGEFSILKSAILNALKQPSRIILSFLLCILICFIQLIIYKLQTDSFLVYSYTQEGFYWTNPQFFGILFSYKKGLFVYTPLILLSFTGIPILYKQSKFSAIAFLLFFILLTYVLSAWWCWYYGGSFGMRAYIEFYALFALLLAISFKAFTHSYQKKIFSGIICILILVCQIQTYQYRYYYIHWSEMTKEKYWEVFMRVDWLIKKTNKPTY